LEIYKRDEFKAHQGKYPVIFLTFKDVKSDNKEEALNKIYSLIREEFGRHKKSILDIIDDLDDEDRYNYYDIIQRRATKDVYEKSLFLLSKLLYQKYNQEIVILIDEYDTPIHASYINGYYSEFIEFIRNLLSGAFKDNSYLFKGAITGILRVSRESIFSGLNNLATYSIVDYEYSDKFGFTISETQKILEDFGLKQRYSDVSNLYNGYKIGEDTIFNPWSIINFVADKNNRLLPYWANTSSNDLVKHLISISSLKFKKSLEIWLKGGSIRSEIDSNIVFSEIERSDKSIYSLLFFSGYLKCLDKELKDEAYYCNLAIPNREVQYIFRNIISNWINESFRNDRLEVSPIKTKETHLSKH
jgi:hypothetical protein